VLDEVAGCHAKIGETDEALTLLERMADERHSNVIWLKHRSQWDFSNLRSEPRFQTLLKRVGLEP
jgi:pentatricopeptide repeat protein